MSALGGDITTMSTNPAGIGLYRSNDVAFTMGWFNPSSKANFNGESHNAKFSKSSFDQIGFVYSGKLGNRTTVRFLNFGFNYRKVSNLNSNFEMGGGMPGGESFSQNIGANMWDVGNTADDFNKVLDGAGNPLNNQNYSWLSILAGQTGYVAGDRIVENPQYWDEEFATWETNYTGFRSENRGGIDAYDFNLALNIKDRVYLGFTVGVYDVDFDRYSCFYENLYNDDITAETPTMFLENWYRLEGSGIDAKLGIIFRPLEYSPLRIGLAVHTPVWYNLSDTFEASMTMEGFQQQDRQSRTDPASENWYDYNLRTPWKFNLSAAYTFGQNIALDAEYEYADYSSSKFSDVDGWDLGFSNRTVKEDLKGVHNFRIGMEARVFDDISLRLGYNYASALYDKAAFKYDDPVGTQTYVDFMNNFDTHNLSLGLGLRFGGFYADMAYIYTHQKAEFHPYSNLIFRAPDPTADVTHYNNRAVVTLGYRF